LHHKNLNREPTVEKAINNIFPVILKDGGIAAGLLRIISENACREVKTIEQK